MNRIAATVTAIERAHHITIVAFESEGQTLNMMALDLGGEIAAGKRVTLGVKASHIMIAKAYEGMISTSNQLQATVTGVTNGELLCSLKLRIGSHTLESIITRASSLRMGLEAGDEVKALIKASELSIVEVLDD